MKNEATFDVSSQSGLPWLLEPITPPQFISKHWGVAPLRLQRSDSSYYANLLPEEDLEFFLAAAARAGDALDILVEDDAPRRCRSHREALTALSQGNSLRIDGIQRLSPPISHLCRSLDKAMGCPVNANMYLTPGRGKKALKRHYDTHDVFVLQIHGKKHWSLFGPPYPFPLEQLPLLRHESIKEMATHRLRHDMSMREQVSLTDEFDMGTGDMLYLPRGFWHEAETQLGEMSCHLTIGIQPVTYLDLFSAAIARYAQEDERLRKPLRLGDLAKDAPAMSPALLKEIAQSAAEGIVPELAWQDLVDHFQRNSAPHLQNRILQPPAMRPPMDTIGQSTILRLRRGLFGIVDQSRTPARISFGALSFEIPSRFVEACCYIASGYPFSLQGLPEALSFEEKAGLVDQLIAERVLVQEVTGNSRPPATFVPVKIDFVENSVTWADLGSNRLTEPFLQQSVHHVRENGQPGYFTKTSFEALTTDTAIGPHCLIFHVSRCGSTLISNALSCFSSANVVSEPQPLSDTLSHLLRGKIDEIQAKDLIVNLVDAYARRMKGGAESLIIKLTSWNILLIGKLREFFPQVPFLIVIRNPAEVAISCLENPPGWMQEEQGDLFVSADKIIGKQRVRCDAMSRCVYGVEAFLKCASDTDHTNISIIDYSDISEEMLMQLGRKLGLRSDNTTAREIRKALAIYSKDPNGAVKFSQDSSLKQSKVTDQLRELLQKHTSGLYSGLYSSRLTLQNRGS